MLGKGKYKFNNEGQSSLYKSDALEKCINKIDSACAEIIGIIKTFKDIVERGIKNPDNQYHKDLFNSLENVGLNSLEMVDKLKKLETLMQVITENENASTLGSAKTHGISKTLKAFEKDTISFMGAVDLLSKNNNGEAVKSLLNTVEDQKKQIDGYDLVEFSNYYETLHEQNLKTKDGKLNLVFSGSNSMEEMASSIVRFCLLGPFSAERKSMVEFAITESAVRFVKSTPTQPQNSEVKNKRVGTDKDLNLQTEIDAIVESSNRPIRLSGGKKHDGWNKELNGELKPNCLYQVDGYLYETDNLGRIASVKGKLKLKKRGRNTHQQGKSVKIKGGISGDQGGHLIARIFNGPGEQINYVPQKGSLNQGAYRMMEKIWADALGKEPPDTVDVEIHNIYDGESKRPIGQMIEYKVKAKGDIDAKVFNIDFEN